jgi:hypothetical protein
MSEVEPGLEEGLDNLVRSMLRGEVVPLLGAGVNLAGRPDGFVWHPREKLLPDGGELATHLATEFKVDEGLADTRDLVRVSQYIYSVQRSGGPMVGELHDIFDAEGLEPGPVHRLLATAAKRVREHGQLRQIPVILTTNYDYLLEQAFEDPDVREPYDLVTYVATSPKEHVGRFMHTAPGREPRPLVTDVDETGAVREYTFEQEEKRTVIVKLHGHVERRDAEDNYVITEDNYIDYLTHANLDGLLPKILLKTLRNSSYLFLGYGMRDWNLRAILRRIWGEQTNTWPSWAIQKQVDPFEKAFWEERGVRILELDLAEYVGHLSAALDRRIENEARTAAS